MSCIEPENVSTIRPRRLTQARTGLAPPHVTAHAQTLPTPPAHDLPDDLPADATKAAAGIALVLVAQLMLILDATVVNVALPHIDADLSFGPAGLSWVLNAYTLAFGGLLLLGGRLGDVFGRRRMFEAGLALFTVASLVGGLAQTPGMLVAARAAQGVGAALAAPGVLALLTTSAPDEAARNRALALFGAVSSGGMSIGLLLGGCAHRPRLVALDDVHQRADRPRRARPDPPLPRRDRSAVPAASTSSARSTATGGAVVGRLGADPGARARLDLGPRHRRPRPRRRAHRPARPHRASASPTRCCSPALLRDPRRVGGLAVIALVVGGQLSMFFLAVQFIEGELGFGPMESGLAFLPLTLGIFAMSRVTPRLLAASSARRR